MNNTINKKIVIGSVSAIGVLGLAALGIAANPIHQSIIEGVSQQAIVKDGTDEAFWDTLRIKAFEAEKYETLAEMGEAADVVVIGRLTDFRANRQFQGDASQDVITYAAVDVKIEKVVRGEAPGSTITLEFMLPAPPKRVPAVVEAQRERMPKGKTVMFLRHKRGEGESGLYRLVNSYGLWISDRGELRSPLAETPSYPDAVSSSYTENLQKSEAERAAIAQATAEGKIDRLPPGLVPSMRSSAMAPIVDGPKNPADGYAAELEGKTSLEDLASIVR